MANLSTQTSLGVLLKYSSRFLIGPRFHIQPPHDPYPSYLVSDDVSHEEMRDLKEHCRSVSFSLIHPLKGRAGLSGKSFEAYQFPGIIISAQ
jgi:hypothetical protein